MDETMDIDERFKARKKHLETMQKLEIRPEKLKIKKYLNYERLNIKSHLYNEVMKNEKIFMQLNSPKQPKL